MHQGPILGVTSSKDRIIWTRLRHQHSDVWWSSIKFEIRDLCRLFCLQGCGIEIQMRDDIDVCVCVSNQIPAAYKRNWQYTTMWTVPTSFPREIDIGQRHCWHTNMFWHNSRQIESIFNPNPLEPVQWLAPKPCMRSCTRQGDQPLRLSSSGLIYKTFTGRQSMCASHGQQESNRSQGDANRESESWIRWGPNAKYGKAEQVAQWCVKQSLQKHWHFEPPSIRRACRLYCYNPKTAIKGLYT